MTTLMGVELMTMTILKLHNYVVPVAEEEVETISALLQIAKMISLFSIGMVMIALGTLTTLTHAVIMTVIPSLQLQLVAHAEEVLQALLALAPALMIFLQSICMEMIAHGMLRTQTPVVFTMMMTSLLLQLVVDAEEVLEALLAQALAAAKMTLR